MGHNTREGTPSLTQPTERESVKGNKSFVKIMLPVIMAESIPWLYFYIKSWNSYNHVGLREGIIILVFGLIGAYVSIREEAPRLSGIWLCFLLSPHLLVLFHW